MQDAKGGPAIVSMNDTEEPGFKNNLPFGVRPYPDFGELVGGCHQQGGKKKEHIPPVRQAPSASLGTSQGRPSTQWRLSPSHSLIYNQRRGLPGAAPLTGQVI